MAGIEQPRLWGCDMRAMLVFVCWCQTQVALHQGLFYSKKHHAYLKIKHTKDGKIIFKFKKVKYDKNGILILKFKWVSFLKWAFMHFVWYKVKI